MLNFIIKGGPIMYPIIIGSIFGLMIVFERFFTFRGMKLDTFNFVQNIFRELKENNIKKALELCGNTSHPIAAVFKIGIERRDLPLDRLEKILEQAGNNQIQKL